MKEKHELTEEQRRDQIIVACCVFGALVLASLTVAGPLAQILAGVIMALARPKGHVGRGILAGIMLGAIVAVFSWPGVYGLTLALGYGLCWAYKAKPWEKLESSKPRVDTVSTPANGTSEAQPAKG